MKLRLLFWFFSLCLLANCSVQAGTFQPNRIITGSHVRIRREPQLSAKEITQLQLGTLVQATERTPQPEAIGKMKDYWFHVRVADGQHGWIFGSFTMRFEPENRDEIYREITLARLARSTLSFPDLVDFFRFLTRASEEVVNRDITAALQFARLQVLQRSLNGQHNSTANVEDWIQEQRESLVFNEPGGEWLVRADLFWELHETYRSLPLADDIAWEAANAPLSGECEGYLPCVIQRLNATQGRYLNFYPTGKYASNALETITLTLKYFVEDSFSQTYSRNEYLMLQGRIKKLRTIVEKTSATETTSVLDLLDRITERYLRHN